MRRTMEALFRGYSKFLFDHYNKTSPGRSVTLMCEELSGTKFSSDMLGDPFKDIAFFDPGE